MFTSISLSKHLREDVGTLSLADGPTASYKIAGQFLFRYESTRELPIENGIIIGPEPNVQCQS